MKTKDFLAIEWSEPGAALIEPPRLSPIIADPSFLLPEETPEGDWQLFAHSAWGVHRYSSPDGLSWRDRGIVAWNAMRPFVRAFGTGAAREYQLLFEAYPALQLARTALPWKQYWRSRVARSRSRDLERWTERETLAKPELPWMRDPALGESVSNPCLLEAGPGDWRLYYSASLAFIEDCGFCEPLHIALATGTGREGPFIPRAKPVIDPREEGGKEALGAGSMKVLRLEDGYVALQNRIYRDPGGHSRSAIFLLASEDGLAWRSARSEPLVAPAASGWTSSHVYACDCRFREADGLWYLYFNARDGWKISEGKERIGRIDGRP